MTDRPVTKARQRRPEARPAEILAAALDLFAEKGFSATRMEDVASRAGLSKAAIYLYFKDKMALLTALVQDMASANLAVAGGIAAGHQGPIAPLLRQIMVFMAGRLRETRFPDLVKVIISESRAHPDIGRLYLETVIRHGLPMFETLLRRGMEQGEFRSADPAFAAKSLVAPVLLAAIWKTVFEPLGAEMLDMEGFVSQHVDIMMRGLAP
jgi:AcrR family transcriptional regulator